MPKLGRVTPCNDCPFRLNAKPGWVGADNPVHFLWYSYVAEGEMPCHLAIDYEDPRWVDNQLPDADFCAGSLLLFHNSLKRPRRRSLMEAVDALKTHPATARAAKLVFQWPRDFINRHLPRATDEQRQAAYIRAMSPADPDEEEA